ncbi:MAG: DUF2892 domain-containing protein [Elusimicrobia bacterium]|nr:DUF2892 domain-containing protein [Elusimicrobiota bacterium]
MSLEHKIRAIAGTFILASLALAHWVDPRFLWFTAFVGANLIQSAFTRWCLMEDILKKAGLAGPGESCCGGKDGSCRDGK